MTRISKHSPEAEVENWNLKYPVGTAVTVTMDDGVARQTTTRSAAAVLSGHSAVIWLDGISGCYLLSRIKAAPPEVRASAQPPCAQTVRHEKI